MSRPSARFCASLFAGLLVLTIALSAQAERKVLVARPAVAKGLSELAVKSIKDGMYRGLTMSKAYAVDEGDIGGEMKKFGVASLSSRADSHKVAKGIGAYAVLRYLAKRQGAQTKVRVVLVLTKGDQLLFVDRVATSDEQLEGVVQQMVVDLMARRTGTAAASAPSTTATSAPVVPPPAEQPSGPSIFSVPNPHARSGFVAEGHVGFSMPTGLDADGVGPGIRGGVHLGWQIGLGNFLSLTPALMVTVVRWGFKDVLLAAVGAESGSLLILDALAGARFTAHFSNFSAWSGFYMGFGWLQQSVAGGGQSASDSVSGFALAWELGGHYMFLPNLGAGLFFDVTKSFVGTFPGAQDSWKATGVGLGLSLRSKF